MRIALARALAAVALAACLAGCGEIWSRASLGSWRQAPAKPITAGFSMPESRVDAAGAGKTVQSGEIARVEVEILESSSYHRDAPRMDKKIAWLWLAWMDDGNRAAKQLLVGQKAGTVMTVDAKSRTPGTRPDDFGGVFLYEEPFGDWKKAFIVYDSVYRMRILESCPAERSEATGTYRRFGFYGSCGGDFLPSHCDAGFVQSAKIIASKVTAKCASGERTFYTAAGDPKERKSTEGFFPAVDKLLARLRKDS